MNQALGFVIAIVLVGIAAGALLRTGTSNRFNAAAASGTCKRVFKTEYERTREIFSDTVEYRSGLPPEIAIETIDAWFSAVSSRGGSRTDIRLVEQTPNCLRYSLNTRMSSFLETAVAASPQGSGSIVTLDVVRWLENDGLAVAKENLVWFREDIELALRAAAPHLQVLVCHDDSLTIPRRHDPEKGDRRYE
ncbi:hypothetical protein BMF89_20510 [Arthrobacter sp. SRS-W-1-2016]|uniref:hypothetical protein n=1 Tax=Arthrobacter sp. SRS-W-1-2016 TaxID=1930254 RepID=UPI000990D716|nr:hypothetical protein [Arthrobacter sp. SRS-W-1-2016]OOP59421.1 hypothetical protein BMF89_20510 [Arthrobacter sp. SRS-W-1-2016]